MHYPVMSAEALDLLAIRGDGLYVDATAGLGGHTGRITARLSEGGVVLACDRDAESLEIARHNTAEVSARIRFRQARFSQLRAAVEAEGWSRVDGLLADLGASRYQLTQPHRGFSFLIDGPLDMRMDTSHGMTAAELINHSAEKAIADLIYSFGEERRARKIARAIVRARPIRSTLHLAGVVERAVPRTGHSRLHPATRTFMALRLAINEEQQELDALLQLGPELVKERGRLVVISFMSLEDRKVKEKFKELGKLGRAVVLTKRPMTPSQEEVYENPASRSAKLRAVEIGAEDRN